MDRAFVTPGCVGTRIVDQTPNSGAPQHGRQAPRMTERFRRVNYGKFEIELTIDDPGAYTKPWTVRLNQSIVLNTPTR